MECFFEWRVNRNFLIKYSSLFLQLWSSELKQEEELRNREETQGITKEKNKRKERENEKERKRRILISDNN